MKSRIEFQKRLMQLAVIILIIMFIPIVFASNPPSVNLSFPGNASLLTANNITFSCNATDDENLSMISLYHDINGSFSENSTKFFSGIEKDGNTTLMCHFENTYSCDGGYGINDSTSFVAGKFMQGVFINDSSTLKYSTSGILNPERGSIEMWIRIDSDIHSGFHYIFDTGTDAPARAYMYTQEGGLYLRFDNPDGEISSDVSNVGWSIGEWHYVVAVWDINTIDGSAYTDIYIDGNSASYNFGELRSYAMGQYIYIGNDYSGSNPANSVFDELRISNRSRTATEISNSYTEGISDHRNETANFTMNVPDGIYSWNCLAYDDESQSTWGQKNFTLYVDSSTPPVVNSISFSSNPTDDLDPGVTINVTANISSIINISSVIFQYKYDLDWINISMSNISATIWNASFTTIDSERIYYYRIIANDTLGHVNTSTTYSRNITWDYTWTVSPENMTALGHVGNISDVGTLLINNTGDDTLIMTISDDWPIVDVYYNTSWQFSVPANSVKYVNITAKFAEIAGSRPMTINISAQPAAPGKTASPASADVIVTMNSYEGGPFIDLSIENLPTYVNQSQKGLNISAVIRNIGNETAANVTFNWSLPSGWLNASGHLDDFIGNISSLSYNVSYLTIDLNSLAYSGVSQVCINASVNGNATYTKCSSVLVSCTSGDGICGLGCTYENDNDCPRPSAIIGSSSSPSAFVPSETAIQRYGISISGKNMAEGRTNEKIYLDVFINNIENKTIVDNTSISVYGYPLSQIKIFPDMLQNITLGNPKSFRVEISIPQYIKYGPYNLSVHTSGKAKRQNYNEGYTNVSADSVVMIFVHSATENQTLVLVADANYSITEMKALGMDTAILENMMQQAEKSLSAFDYDNAKTFAETIIDTRNQAFSAKSLIDEVSGKLEKASAYKVAANETEKFYQLAVSAFARGDYKRAQERASGAILAYGIEAEPNVSIFETIENNRQTIMIAILATIISLVIASIYASSRMKRQKIENLYAEEKAIVARLKALQSKFFEKNEMSKQEYEAEKELYEKRISVIKSHRARLEAPRRFFIFGKSRESQRERILNTIKEVQKERYEKGDMDKKIYKNTIDELRKELAEIDRKSLNGKKKFILFISFLIILSSLMHAVYAVPNISMGQEIGDSQRARDAILLAEADINESQKMGFGIKRMNDTLSDAKIMLYRGNYVESISLSLYVDSIKNSAVRSNLMIDSVEEGIQNSSMRGIDTTAAKEFFNKGVDAFNSEIYEDSEKYLNQSMNSLEEAENAFLIKSVSENTKENPIISFIRNEWKLVTIVLAVLVALSIIAFKLTGTVRRLRHIAKLKNEKKNITSEIRNIQARYFERGKMPKSEYKIIMKKYNMKIEDIDKKLFMLGAK